MKSSVKGISFKAKSSGMGMAAASDSPFVFHDDGTATLTLQEVDAAGLPTSDPMPAGASVPAYTVDTPTDPPEIVLTPASDGMSATLAPSNPPQLTKAPITITGTVTLADGSTWTDTTQGIVVVAGGPKGFKLKLG